MTASKSLHPFLPVCVALLLLGSLMAPGRSSAQEPPAGLDLKKALPTIPARTPEQSREQIVTRDGFRVELVAAEPLVRDPVAIDFDEAGRMFVIELPQYNGYAIPKFKARGSIRMLEDRDGDGRYEKSTVYLDGLDYPTAIACWDGGLLVGAAPDLLYVKDTDGDGKADERKVLLTGFGKDRAGEAHLNSIRWGLDNRFHLSTSLAGGTIRAVGDKPGRPRSCRGRGIILDPRAPHAFELTTGGGQHGMSMDDWGRKFVCSNSVPAQMLMFDDRYLARNPYLAAPSAAINIAPEGKFTRLYRISPTEPWRALRTRLRKEGKFRGSDEGGKPFGFFTGATGVTIYRGDAWPPSHRGNLIVGDVANNLIYRARIEPRGLQVIARRADAKAEFVASKDIWFRPVQFACGPDGNLYVLDMYRQLIEGAAFLPPYFMKVLNAVGGNDRGRIYRIVHTGAKRRRSAPRLGELSSAQLAEFLAHANGWHRDTASRLLCERQDRKAVPAIRRVAFKARSPQGRVTALYSLAALNALQPADVERALNDPTPEVRIHGLRVAESLVGSAPQIRARLVELTADPSLHVRYQLAYSLGAFQGTPRNRALAKLVRRDANDPWMRLAIQSSLNRGADEVFSLLARDPALLKRSKAVRGFLITLVRQIGAAGRKSEMAVVLNHLQMLPAGQRGWSEQLLQALLEKQKGPARALIAAAKGGQAGAILAKMIQDARAVAADTNQAAAARADAVRSLQLAPYNEVSSLLGQMLDLRQPQPVQAAALETLAGYDNPQVAKTVLAAWRRLSPALRAQAAETVLSRPIWIALFLDAVEKKSLPRSAIDPARVALLKRHPDPQIAKRVTRLFAGQQVARRGEVIAAYRAALKLRGEPARGKLVFKKNCSACHQLEGVGKAIGAELRGIRQRGLEAVLLNILDPNREVKPKFLSYSLRDADGRVLTGMIRSENANSVTIQRPDGSSATVQRIDIEDLRNTGLSFMPEGLEKEINLQAMADLLAYLDSL